jgi:hypothetical protein
MTRALRASECSTYRLRALQVRKVTWHLPLEPAHIGGRYAIRPPSGEKSDVRPDRREFRSLMGGAAAWPHAAHSNQPIDAVRGEDQCRAL